MKKILASMIIISGIVFVGNIANAVSTVEEIITSFRKYQDVIVPSINVPRVVEVTLKDFLQNKTQIQVFDITDNTFQPSRYFNYLPLADVTEIDIPGFEKMTDYNSDTYEEFLSDGFSPKTETIHINIQNAMSHSVARHIEGIVLELSEHVALPTNVAVYDEDNNKYLVTNKRLNSTRIIFPVTNTSKLRLELTHIQPLRISNIGIIESGKTINGGKLRFLAQPGHKYRLYFDADRYESVSVGESADLSSDKDIVFGELSEVIKNTAFVPADIDGDSIPDMQDNCVRIANADQIDVDNNGRGDACDDFDKDGVINSKDNCQNQPNRYQKDTDGDGIGDACDIEESRLSEKYPWLQWVAMGLVALVLLVLGGIVSRDMRK